MIAQMGVPDMKLPIQYALTYPDRIPSAATTPFDIWNSGALTFGAPDPDTFRCLALALKAAETGGTAGAILNGANEAAVPMFLSDRISFLDIARLVEGALERVPVVYNPSLEDILAADEAARSAVNELLR
jgi:1-deoxy-D-xylulose-5-phosphate reductoisomerase